VEKALFQASRRARGSAGLVLASRAPSLGPGSRLLDGPLETYLDERALERQPPDVQRFLLDTAILERFTPQIAATVSGQPHARETIEECSCRS